MSDGDILALNHMDDNFALFHKLQVFRWSLFDKWTKFATLNEDFVEDDWQKVCVVVQLFFFNDTSVGGPTFSSIILMLLLALLDLIENDLSPPQCV